MTLWGTDLAHFSINLFESTLNWFRQNYQSYLFYVERNLVWTVQAHLRSTIEKNNIPLRVYNDYSIKTNDHRRFSADLALVDMQKQVLLAIEFKYEPSHKRKDIPVTKFPVVFWGMAGIAKDIERIQQFVTEGKAQKAMSLFVDEGGFFHHRPAHSGSVWEAWDNGVWVLRSIAGT